MHTSRVIFTTLCVYFQEYIIFNMLSHLTKEFREPTEKYKQIKLEESKYKSEGQKRMIYAFYCL